MRLDSLGYGLILKNSKIPRQLDMGLDHLTLILD